MSMQRRCDFTKCADGKWYMTLGNNEHSEDDWDCTVYGPFESEEKADDFLRDNFANPGGRSIDDSGTELVPKDAKSPSQWPSVRGLRGLYFR